MVSLLAFMSAAAVIIATYMIFAVVCFGSVLAMIISWNRNRSVLWAILHGWLSWFYVIYYSLKCKPGLPV